jgi:hypothetical protein
MAEKLRIATTETPLSTPPVAMELALIRLPFWKVETDPGIWLEFGKLIDLLKSKMPGALTESSLDDINTILADARALAFARALSGEVVVRLQLNLDRYGRLPARRSNSTLPRSCISSLDATRQEKLFTRRNRSPLAREADSLRLSSLGKEMRIGLHCALVPASALSSGGEKIGCSD